MGTQNSKPVSTGLERIAELARANPAMVFHSIHHQVDHRLLYAAYVATRKGGAVGIDGVTAEQYAENLQENLDDLLNRFRSGRYLAPAVRRVHIPKGKGKTRPIGIPTFEDKVLQRAVAWSLEVICEQDFLPCSFGFRPGRSAHDALIDVRDRLKSRGGWVIDLDIERFFDTLDHGHLRKFLDQRVRDGVLRKAIDRWLKAGVMEAGSVRYEEAGTPQGGVISPLLANIYLHEVLDRWFSEEIQPRLRGRSGLTRYADDAILTFEREDDARRVLKVLPKRFAKFGLRLHPEKTRLVQFCRPKRGSRENPRHGSRPQSFNFLGFTHYWSHSARYDCWVVKCKTAKDRLQQSIAAVWQWCRRNRHLSIGDQWRILSAKLRGHYAYYGLPGNSRSLSQFRWATAKAWQKWLARRSQRGMPWWRFRLLYERYPLPYVRMIPATSLVAKH